jgi:FlaA1/EpsC-like NDP-sugar epimerase
MDVISPSWINKCKVLPRTKHFNRMKIINLAKTLLRKNSWFVGAFQATLILVSLILAWFLRFDFTLPNRQLLFGSACLLIAIRMAAITGFGLLHGWWRYTGLSDALDVAKAVFTGSVVFVLVMRYVLQVETFPRAVFVLEAVLTAGILIGVRVFSRVLAESVRQEMTASKRVLLVGAGIGAQTVVREIQRPGSEYTPVGYVDDDRSKLGLNIEGIRVLGTVDQIPELVDSHLGALGHFPANAAFRGAMRTDHSEVPHRARVTRRNRTTGQHQRLSRCERRGSSWKRSRRN